MPFTFSHPAIVLPFGFISPRWVSMNGLIVGSMSPDFEYFLRMKVFSIYSHTWLGVLWFNVPLVLLFLVLFHAFIRDPLIDHLPLLLRRRFTQFKGFRWQELFTKRLIVVIISIIIGAYSHILWDSCSHKDGAIVESFAFFRSTVSLGFYEVPLYKLIQHGSTLLGFLIILGVIYKMPVSGGFVVKKSKLTFWLLVFGACVLVTTLRSLVDSGGLNMANLIATVIAGGFIGLLVAGVSFHFRGHKKSAGGMD
jgi:hypothetical protein